MFNGTQVATCKNELDERRKIMNQPRDREKTMKKVIFSALMGLLLTNGLAMGKTPPIKLAASHVAGAEKGGPLGDLSNYIAIAKDTLKIVKESDVKAGRVRIKDLESAWDDAEDKQRPLSPDDWEVADKAIDRALAKLRSGRPDKEASISSLKSLIATLEKLNKPK